jgi:NAD(P)H-nitrite reductase large subunit
MARRHLLIGSGPAAIAAAEAIRSVDADAEIVALSADPHGYYSRPGLAYYLANELPEKGLFPFAAADFARLNIQLVLERAIGIDPVAHTVSVEGGRQLLYDRLLIATGSAAIPVRVPGAELDGVVKLDDMSDARELIRRSRKGKSAVVVGGGITALEIVEGLRAHRGHVHYFMRRDRYWSNVLSEAESHIVEDGLRSRGVEIHYFTQLAEIVGRDGRVVAVRTEKDEQVACDLVAIAIGVMPQTDLAKAAGIDCDRGILVDEYLKSSSQDIFAAGDVAEVCDPLTDRRTIEVLWSAAVAKGRVAGLNMATEPTRVYDEGAPLNVTRLAGFKITIIGTVGNGDDSDLEGIARGDSETWRELGDAVTVESQTDDTHVRLELGASTLVGAVVMGEQELSFPLQELIEARVDISPISSELQIPGAPLGRILEEFWNSWRGSRV